MKTFIAVAVVASILDLASAWALQGGVKLTGAARILVALLPLPGNIALIALVLRAVRALDEFKKRIHFEAVVVAFLATGVAVFIYAYLRQAGAVGPLHAALVWAFMGLSYAAGYLVAIRHYR